MQQNLENIKNEIMSQIREGRLKMRSKAYFLLGSVLALGGLVVSIATSSFIFSLIFFSLRARGPMSGFRLQFLVANFPWWLSLLAILGLIFGVFLMRRYDFSYKINLKIAIVLFVLVVILSGWLIDVIGMNDLLARRGPMRGMMGNYFQEKIR